jgi:hypothetical protein
MATLNQAVACQRRGDEDEAVALFRWAKVASPLENEVRLEVVPGTRELKGGMSGSFATSWTPRLEPSG